MCLPIFGGSKTPKQEPIPTQSPAPSIIEPSSVSALRPEEDLKRRRDRIRGGLASTVKTSGRGITGAGAELLSPSLGGKSKLGS